jgi:hypothetical protein
MQIVRIAGLLVFFSLSYIENVSAQSTVGPNGASCMTPWGPAIQMNGNGPAWALTRVPPMVPQPVIIYTPLFYQLPPYMQVFTSDHECGHANGATDEFTANCFALNLLFQKGGNAQTVLMIRQFHYGIGAVGPQYGGSGMAFWQLTYQRCPQLAIQP